MSITVNKAQNQIRTIIGTAIEKAKAGVGDGMFLDSSVIAGPDERLWESIL